MPIGLCSIPNENKKTSVRPFRGQGDAAVGQIASIMLLTGTQLRIACGHTTVESQLAGVFGSYSQLTQADDVFGYT